VPALGAANGLDRSNVETADFSSLPGSNLVNGLRPHGLPACAVADRTVPSTLVPGANRSMMPPCRVGNGVVYRGRDPHRCCQDRLCALASSHASTVEKNHHEAHIMHKELVVQDMIGPILVDPRYTKKNPEQIH
jgi:hypothetical protein